MSSADTSNVQSYMPLWIADYMRDTMHLTTTEHGAYLLILFAYWVNGGPLKDDDRRMAAITKMSAAEWKRIKPAMAEYFDIKGGKWRQKRADHELERAREIRQRRVDAGKKGAKSTWQNDGKGDGKSMASPMAKPMAKPMASPMAGGMANGQQNAWQNDGTSPSPSPRKKGSDSSIELSGAGSAAIEADEIVPPPTAKPSRPPRKPEQPTLDITGPLGPPAPKAEEKPPPSAEQMINRVMWGDGLKYLMNNGLDERLARSMIGRWRSKHGDAATLDAISRAQTGAIMKPIEFISKILGAGAKSDRKTGQYGGDRAQGAARTRDQERHDTRLAALAGFGSDGGGGGEPWSDDYGEREYDPGGS